MNKNKTNASELVESVMKTTGLSREEVVSMLTCSMGLEFIRMLEKEESEKCTS